MGDGARGSGLGHRGGEQTMARKPSQYAESQIASHIDQSPPSPRLTSAFARL